MPYGNIVRIELARGFGFIRDDAGFDWFFVEEGVRNGRLDSVWVGERVGFAAEWVRSGPRATDVHHEQLD
jgi:cold shock CspA family protein